jgi:hypothetical protein
MIRGDKNLLMTLVGWKMRTLHREKISLFVKIVENRSNVLDTCVKQDRLQTGTSGTPFDRCHCSLHRTDTIMSDDGNLAHCHRCS